MIPMVFNIVLFCLSLRTSTALKTVSENTYVSSTCKSCAPKATTDIFHSSKQRIIQGHLQVTEAGGLNLQRLRLKRLQILSVKKQNGSQVDESE